MRRVICTGASGPFPTYQDCFSQNQLHNTSVSNWLIIDATWNYSSGWHSQQTRNWNVSYYEIISDGIHYGNGTNPPWIGSFEEIGLSTGWDSNDHSFTDVYIREFTYPDPTLTINSEESSGPKTQEISLQSDWNLISLPVII